ncbi:hypothetical protein ACMD2_21446 [Ananas comosus]|uniref:Uncharacterized protein n=1 Tax=Ananas comosus TaxID=4615 RepID=A0A199VMD4_ANACO|nr:hypothetical protein ACMD2_21446 [Ananas comosus]
MDRPLEPFLGPLHHLRAEPHHQDAELGLVERAVAVEVPLPHHRRRLLRRHPRHPENRSRVPPQALGRDHPPRGVRQRPETPAELRHEVVRREPRRHRREQVLVLGRHQNWPCFRLLRVPRDLEDRPYNHSVLSLGSGRNLKLDKSLSGFWGIFPAKKHTKWEELTNISWKSSRACLHLPCTANPIIIEFQEQRFLLSPISSNTRRALSMLPHFAYISTKALLTNTFPTSPFSLAYLSILSPNPIAPRLAQAGRTLASVTSFGRASPPSPHILRNTRTASSHRPLRAYPDTRDVHDTTFRSGMASNSSPARARSPPRAYPAIMEFHTATSRRGVSSNSRRAGRGGRLGVEVDERGGDEGVAGDAALEEERVEGAASASVSGSGGGGGGGGEGGEEEGEGEGVGEEAAAAHAGEEGEGSAGEGDGERERAWRRRL